MIPRSLQITVSLLLLALLGAAVYGYQLRQHDLRTARNQEEAALVPVPAAGTTTKITLAIAYDEDQVVRDREATAILPSDPTGKAHAVLHELIAYYLQKPSPHVLGPGSDVREVFLVDGSTAVVDLNEAFASGHRSGIFVEQIALASMVQTLAENVPSIQRVKFIVDGKERETLAGHADLSTVYDVAVVRQMIASWK